jgi:23S rRNA (cytosine1962-C5)-methyltransferase
MTKSFPNQKQDDIRRLLNDAFAFRDGLQLGSNAMRLVNGVGDKLPGLIIDRYNKHFVIYALDGIWRSQKNLLKEVLQNRFDLQYLVFKDRTATPSPVLEKDSMEILIAGASQTVVEENGIQFHVDLNDHLNQGLFLDMRKNRRLVASFSKDKDVLNCFAYTCSFGAHCRHAGALRVVNVDISSKFLKKGEENYKLNHLKTGRSEFMREHAIRYIEKAAKRNNLFDVIILDPPSFSRYEGKVFSVKKDMPALLAKAMLALKEHGVLFVSTNLSTVTRAQLETWAWTAAKSAGALIVEIDKLGQDVDFRGSGLVKESNLSALLLKIKRHSFAKPKGNPL